jgi:hypothetical protein
MTDLIGASLSVEAAIHGSAVGPSLAAAAAQVTHARDYFAASGYPDLAAEAAVVATGLADLQTTPASDLYAVIWGRPVEYGTLAHLWRRTQALIRPENPWPALLGVAGVLGAAVAVGVAVRGGRP